MSVAHDDTQDSQTERTSTRLYGILFKVSICLTLFPNGDASYLWMHVSRGQINSPNARLRSHSRIQDHRKLHHLRVFSVLDKVLAVVVSSHKRSRPSPRLPVVYIYGRRSGSRQPLRRSTPQITLDHKTYTRSSTSTTPENIRLSQYFVRSFAFKMESYLNSPVCTE